MVESGDWSAPFLKASTEWPKCGDSEEKLPPFRLGGDKDGLCADSPVPHSSNASITVHSLEELYIWSSCITTTLQSPAAIKVELKALCTTRAVRPFTKTLYRSSDQSMRAAMDEHVRGGGREERHQVAGVDRVEHPPEGGDGHVGGHRGGVAAVVRPQAAVHAVQLANHRAGLPEAPHVVGVEVQRRVGPRLPAPQHQVLRDDVEGACSVGDISR
ncbi:hypothetical protein TYRP_004063 [Tyrophagus putrescentiae]|nr:hypothetical protein TYRP_004063 [Tyrophagus putrescentiae]